MDCKDCETLFINPRPTPTILEKFYEQSENYIYFKKYIFPVSEKARRKKIFYSRAKRVNEICRKYNKKE